MRPGSGRLSSVVLLYPPRIRWRKVSGPESSVVRSHRIVVQVNCVCFPSWLTWASRHNDPASWKLALKNIFLVKRKSSSHFTERNAIKRDPENYQFTTEEAESKKVFPRTLEIGLEIILLTFPNTKTDSQRGQDQTQHRDDDGESRSEAETLQDPGQASPRVGRLPLGVEAGEVVEAAGGARVVVSRHLQVVGGPGLQTSDAVHILQLQVVCHCRAKRKSTI